MKKRPASKAAIGGAILGGLHFLAICGLAAIVIREQHSGVSAEYWEYASIFDLPANLVALGLRPLVHLLSGAASLPDVAFLPGIIGSWDKFLFPFLVYGGIGTAVWFLIGWVVMRISASRYLP